MSGEIGILLLLPIVVAGAGVIVAGGAIGLAGYGLYKGIQLIMDPGRSRPQQPVDPDRLADLRRQMEADTLKELSSFGDRQKRQEASARELKSALGDLERASQEQLRANQEAFLQRLASQRGEYLALIEAEGRKTAAALEGERKARQQALSLLQGAVQAILADAQRVETTARAFLEDLETIVGAIDRLPHRRFAPDKMEKVRRQLEDARRSLLAGMPEAALSRAQSAYWDAVDLRQTVVEKEREFVVLHKLALQDVSETLGEIAANRVHILDLSEGEEKVEFELDVNHWTRGDLDTLEREVVFLRDALKRDESSMDAEAVKVILDQVGAVRPRIAAAVDNARKNLCASQVRANLGELAVSALTAQGFEAVDSAYEGDDERNAFTVKLRNIAGGEVVAVIDPGDGSLAENTVLVNSYDETFIDEATIQQRAGEIVAALRAQGIQTGIPRCIGPANTEYRDLDRVRQRKVESAKAERRRVSV